MGKFIEMTCYYYFKIFPGVMSKASYSDKMKKIKTARATEGFKDKYNPYTRKLMDKYLFPRNTNIKNLKVLEFGSGFGGRGIDLIKRYNIKTYYGLDISFSHCQKAKFFANKIGYGDLCNFLTYDGIHMPFDNNLFDRVFSISVFEHVSNPEKSLNEIFRVLKPGGICYIEFPPFHFPLNSHMDYATKSPFVHSIFQRDVLVNTYIKILKEKYPEIYGTNFKIILSDWEKTPTLNGLTISRTNKILKKTLWRKLNIHLIPLFATGKMRTKSLILRIISKITPLFVKFPYFKEFFTHRIAIIGTK